MHAIDSDTLSALVCLALACVAGVMAGAFRAHQEIENKEEEEDWHQWAEHSSTLDRARYTAQKNGVESADLSPIVKGD